MKMTILDVLGSFESLKQLGTGKLPMQVALTIAKNRRVIDECVDLFNERKEVLVKKYGKENKETGNMTVDAKHVKAFTNQIKKMTSEEVDLAVKKIKVSEFGKGFQVEGNTMYALDWMIEQK